MHVPLLLSNSDRSWSRGKRTKTLEVWVLLPLVLQPLPFYFSIFISTRLPPQMGEERSFFVSKSTGLGTEVV